MKRVVPMLLLLELACIQPRRKVLTRPTGVNHRIEKTFQTLMDTGALTKQLPSGWKLDRFASNADSVTLGFLDGTGTPHSVSLMLKLPAGISPQGRGQFFEFVVPSDESPENMLVLLAAGTTVDAATPLEALVAEVSSQAHPQTMEDKIGTTTPTVAVILGALQSALVLLAILVGLLFGRRSERTD